MLNVARNAFRMPRPIKITGRTSTITNAFVNAIIPVVEPTDDDILSVLRVLDIDAADVRCAYCGDPSTEWDHLEPIVSGKRPTGYISEIANLVPACGKCNQSKSGRHWREWIEGPAALSPKMRGIQDLKARIKHLRGSHRQFKHPTKWGRWGLVTVTGHSGYDLAVGALDNILRQAR